MTITQQAVNTAVDRLITEFEARPADFNKEKSLQSRLRFLLEEELEPAQAEVAKTNLDRDGVSGTIQDRVVHTLHSAETIPRVVEEAGFGAQWGNEDSNQDSLDIAVLPKSADFYMDASSKWYRLSEVEAAIELKFIKKDTKIDGNRDSIESQIDRLKQFDSSTAAYMIVFAVKDVFSDQQHIKEEMEIETPGTFLYTCTPLS